MGFIASNVLAISFTRFLLARSASFNGLLTIKLFIFKICYCRIIFAYPLGGLLSTSIPSTPFAKYFLKCFIADNFFPFIKIVINLLPYFSKICRLRHVQSTCSKTFSGFTVEIITGAFTFLPPGCNKCPHIGFIRAFVFTEPNIPVDTKNTIFCF